MAEGGTRARVGDTGIRDLMSIAESKLEMARQLDIIPLRDGSLTSLAAGPVYWPTSAGAHIPADTPMRVIHEAAIKCDGHAQMLKMLGVQKAPVHVVRSLIVQKHANLGQLLTLTACKEHLHFLYLTHEYRHSDAELRNIYILDQKLRLKRPREEDVHLPGWTPFNPEEVLSHLETTDSGGLSCSTSYMNPVLLDNAPSVPVAVRFGVAAYPTWKGWLCDSLGVLEQIQLANRTGDSLSDEFARVSQRRPDLVLGVLAHVWKTQHQTVSEKPELVSKIRNIPVPCGTGDRRPLWETYIPFRHLQGRCLEFMKPNEPFPFLDFGAQLATEDLSTKWAFLYRDLGVSKNDDLGMLLDILSYIQEANPDGLSSQRCRELVRLYCEIEAACVASDEPESARGICRSFIEDINGIAIPQLCGHGPRWADSKQCVWDGPAFSTAKIPLRHVHEDILQCDPRELAILSKFYSHTLKCSD
ncbi:hypothetical protein J3F83DRAFT_106351 [Trichoderma novae-zelandiae]